MITASPHSIINTHQQHPEEPHHVHFDEAQLKDDFSPDNNITLQKSECGKIVHVHLGFLQFNHRYHVDLNVPVNFFSSKPEDIFLMTDGMRNLNCNMTEANGHDGKSLYYGIGLKFFASKSKLQKEEINIINDFDQEKIKLICVARVLGKGKGTPMLRNGIHCEGAEPDEESEASDWQGFSKE